MGPVAEGGKEALLKEVWLPLRHVATLRTTLVPSFSRLTWPEPKIDTLGSRGNFGCMHSGTF
jgi:hypothetical protein